VWAAVVVKPEAKDKDKGKPARKKQKQEQEHVGKREEDSRGAVLAAGEATGFA